MNGYDYILQWLKRSRLTIPLHNRKGLYWCGKDLSFPDHFIMEALEFAQSLDIWDGDLWGDYPLRYTCPVPCVNRPRQQTPRRSRIRLRSAPASRTPNTPTTSDLPDSR